MTNSFQLIRTNPRLTTNYKIVVSSEDKLYLESFNSSKELNNDKYKHMLMPVDAVLEDILPKFYDSIPKNIAFSPKLNDDINIMYNTFNNQFDNMYYSGAKSIEDQWYKEEFEYFAPLYIVKNKIPSNFIIMRIDDPVVYVKEGNDYVLGNLNKDNFRDEIINKWKCISNFDLSDNTNLGKFINRNINDNERFPDYSFFFDTKKYNFSKWNGMDFNTGIYTEKEMFLDDYIKFQRLHFELEDFITKGFENNSVIYPYILNFNFLFDDEPATKDQFKKYSMNRYFGFYVENMEHIKTITTYNLKKMKSNLIIKNNIFLIDDGSGNKIYVNPFIDETINNEWVIIDNNIYEIRKQSNNSFKLISDVIFNETNFTLNQIQSAIIDNSISMGNDVIIDDYIYTLNDTEINSNFYADLYLIEIDGVFHVLKNNQETDSSGNTIKNNYYIQSDYNINSNSTTLKYYKGGVDSQFSVKKNTLVNDKPLIYKIYRIKFLDIKDFDFDRINTQFANFDYEQSEYVDTLEKKLTAIEYNDNSIPKRKKIIPENIDGQYKQMNISSEYIADDELFEINKNKINPIWDKIQTICKWGYRGSLSHGDYEYKLNTLLENGGVFNRTTNTELTKANSIEKNIDYLYRIGEFYAKGSQYFINFMNFNRNDLIYCGWSGNVSYWEIDKNNKYINVQNDGDGESELTYIGVGKDENGNDYSISNPIHLEIGSYYYVSFSVMNFNTTILSSGAISVYTTTTLTDSSKNWTVNQYADNYLSLIIGNEEFVYKINSNTANTLTVNRNITTDITGKEYKITNTKVGIKEGVFDKDLILTSSPVSYTYSATLKATSNIFKLIARNVVHDPSYYTFSKLLVIKVDDKFYLNQSTNIQTKLFNNLNNIGADTRFNLSHYINSDFDYFEYFFNNNMIYTEYGKEKIKPYLKYSTFNSGDSELPATSLFKGIEYRINNVDEMVLDINSQSVTDEQLIRNIIYNGGETYNGYKISVILGETYNYYDIGNKVVNITEENILPNGYGAWGEKLALGSTGQTSFIVNDILPAGNKGWGYIYSTNDLVNEPDTNTLNFVSSNLKFTMPTTNNNGGKPIWEIILNPLSNRNLSNQISNRISKSSTYLSTDTGFTYNVDISIKVKFVISGWYDNNVYKLILNCSSFKDSSNINFFNNLNYYLFMDMMIPPTSSPTSGEYTREFTITKSATDLKWNELNNIFKLKYTIEHTNSTNGSTEPVTYYFHNHKSTIITLDKLLVTRVKKDSVDGINDNENVNIIRTPSDTVETIVIGSQPYFQGCTTYYEQEYFKLDDNVSSSYDVKFKFRYNLSFLTTVVTDKYHAKFYCSDFSTDLSGTIFYKYGPNPDDPSQPNSSTGLVEFSLNNVKFISTDNTIKFNVNLYNDVSFGNNIEARVELVEVIIDKTTPSLDYDETNVVYKSKYNNTFVSNTEHNSIIEQLNTKNGIHVFMNKKYKNILIINNKVMDINREWLSLNNIDFFDNNYGLYYGKTIDEKYLIPVNNPITKKYNPDLLTAQYYIQAMNDLNKKGVFDNNITYYLIDKGINTDDYVLGKTVMTKFGSSSMTNIWDKNYPPFIIEVNSPNVLETMKNTDNIMAVEGPIDLLNDKYIVYKNRTPISQSVIDEPLGRYIYPSYEEYFKTSVYHGNNNGNKVEIKRFNGYYEPIFKNIQLFKSNYIWKNESNEFNSFIGNYRFNTDLEQFGYINEVMYSKVNETENILKLKNEESYNSIYPMVDEIGLSQTDRFIFLSTWDNNYYIRTISDIDFLELFKDVSDIVVETPITGSIVSFSVTIPSYFTNGVKLYSNNNSTNQLKLQMFFKNTSMDSYEYFYRVKYYSPTYDFDIIIKDETSIGTINANEISPVINIFIDRPDKVNSNVSVFELYTTWYIKIDVYTADGIVVDSNNSTYFNIYNELVDFNINSFNIVDDNDNQICNNNYQFNVVLEDSIKKLNNIPIEMIVTTSSLDYPSYSNILLYRNTHNISNISTISKNINALIGQTVMDDGYGGFMKTDTRKYKTEVKYSYVADNTTHNVIKNLELPIDINQSYKYVSREYNGLNPYEVMFGNLPTFNIYALNNSMGGSGITPRIVFKMWNNTTQIKEVDFVGKLYDGFTNQLISEYTLYSYLILPYSNNLVHNFMFDFAFGLNGEPIEIIIQYNRYYYATLSITDINTNEIIETMYTNWISGYPVIWNP